jgi:hypothetical protein
MSVDAGIYATLLRPSERADHLQIVSSLIEGGWRPDDDGRIVYLPKGDADRFEWRSAHLEHLDDVWQELKTKAAAGELIGIGLTWEQSGIGGQFLVEADWRMTLSATIHRVTLPETRITDVSWYITRLAAAMARASIYVESLKWVESGH